MTDFATELEHMTCDALRVAAGTRKDIGLISDFSVITTGDEAEPTAALEKRLGGEHG